MTDMVLLYSTEASRHIDAAAQSEMQIDAHALMVRAGKAAWQVLLDNWPQAQRILVVCGPGNNGGDGYVLAELARASGRNVKTVRLAQGSPRTPEAKQACVDWLQAGEGVIEYDGHLSVFDGSFPDVVVDALFGTGLTRAPQGEAADLIEKMEAARCPILSLDVPSGVDADTGNVPGSAVRAAVTLTFITHKIGLHTGMALDHVGRLEFVRLDVPITAYATRESGFLRTGGALRKLGARNRDSHKGNYGHVLCIGGDHGTGGAILLTAQAALRVGAGLVSVATRQSHVTAFLATRPEIMVSGIEDIQTLQKMLAQTDVIALGPGLGMSRWGRMLFDAVIDSGLPMVVDADALTLLAEHPRLLPRAILTPHPGEAARLLGNSVAEIQADRLAAACAITERYKARTVLKGAGTIVAKPGAIPDVIAGGNPGMATGGMGDVLTGTIAGLLAQEFDGLDVATFGAVLHAAAGDAAAVEDGERGLLPSDLLPWLRRLANPQVGD